MSRTAGSVKAIKPVGSQILVEMLTAQESYGTIVNLSAKTVPTAPQAYILALGPAINSENWGFDVGDRVLVQGTYVPAPKVGNSERVQGLIEPSNIKAVLTESSILEN